ncbi:sulfonate ABC transporter [Alicyclobacillus cellulosilyticus]|uniref:Sulfonate ABC transporter n=1 Tax=Alicyclobacillus cellulosilyticus TaxID=1003997 RepID=A0A917KF98_9BACL|nr:aliphatic sulfonate ABC transporter permease SsuC [Alicyclobacillus cellulosilyticus]GGJ09732.1 sulfonate ABC transporter [Alicyclobacillus cellulosilyticus]
MSIRLRPVHTDAAGQEHEWAGDGAAVPDVPAQGTETPARAPDPGAHLPGVQAAWRRAHGWGNGLWRRLSPWLVPALAVVVWQALGSAGVIPTRVLPTPIAVVQAFLSLAHTGELWQDIAVSARRAAIGFAVGAGTGLLLGLVNGVFSVADRLLDSSVQMIRTIPHLALIPLVILWFGIGETAKEFLVALGAMFPVYLNTYHGVRGVDAGLVEMARMYGLTGWAFYRHVLFPGALPSILVGVRYALGITWTTLIVAETISADAGIGYMVMNAREFVQMDVVVLGIVLYALLGKLSDVVARLLERWLLPWRVTWGGDAQ